MTLQDLNATLQADVPDTETTPKTTLLLKEVIILVITIIVIPLLYIIQRTLRRCLITDAIQDAEEESTEGERPIVLPCTALKEEADTLDEVDSTQAEQTE